jgi:hypothetical protein
MSYFICLKFNGHGNCVQNRIVVILILMVMEIVCTQVMELCHIQK